MNTPIMHMTMMPRLVPLIVLVVSIGTLGAPINSEAQSGQTTLASRMSGGGVRSLLVDVRNPGGGPVDEIRIELPSDADESAVVMLSPDGWQSAYDGRWIRVFGPAVAAPFPVRIALFDTPSLSPLRTRIRADGDDILDEQLPVASRPALETAARSSGFLQAPAGVSPGETLEMTVLDPGATPSDGEWIIGGSPATPGGASRIRAQLPDDLQTGSPLRVTYFDRWGERVVDALLADDVVVTEPNDTAPDTPRITGCAQYGILGQSVCVCGSFPETSWGGLQIDGQPAAVTAASAQVVHIQLPTSLAPGDHSISGDPGAGFSGDDTVSTSALRVSVATGSPAMFRDDSTTMRLSVEGSTDAVLLGIVNRTPEVVGIPGGNYQETTTSGGTDNGIDWNVDAHSVGNFLIDTYVPDSACPCAALPEGLVSSASRDDPLFVPRRVLATIAAATPQEMLATAQTVALANGLAVVEITPIPIAGEAIVLFEILNGVGPVAAAAALAADPNVTLSQPDFVYDVSQTGSAASRLVYGPRMIGADVAGTVSTGQGIRIAVIDAGVDVGHEALAPRIVDQIDVTGTGMTPDAHGTLVAGVIAAEAVESDGFQGVAPQAELVAIKSCVAHTPTSASARCWTSTLARGIDEASRKNVRVINLSVGGPEDQLLAKVVNAARAAGIAVVSAAGNDGPSGKPSFPAAFDDVIAVTAVDAAERIYDGATRGGFVDLAAPGVDIFSTGPGGRTQLFTGTSAATAFISGAVALLLEQTDLSPDEIGALLRETARDLGDAVKSQDTGNNSGSFLWAGILEWRPHDEDRTDSVEDVAPQGIAIRG